MTDRSQTTDFIPAYEGNDMAGYIMKKGFKLPDYNHETIRSITNIRDTAIIVTDYSVYRAKPSHQIGFCIEIAIRF